MEHAQTHSAQTPDVVPRSHRLIRRLVVVYAAALVASVAFLAVLLVPEAWLPQTTALAREIVAGAGGIVLATLLLATTSLLGTLALTTARFRHAQAPPSTAPRKRGAARAWSLADPGFAARQGQAIVMLSGVALTWIAARALWPSATPASSGTVANVAGAFVLGLAFVSLVAERVIHEFPEPQLPEAPQVRRVLLFATIALALAACVEFGRAAAIEWLYWPSIVLVCLPGVIGAELALRASARLFLPPPGATAARAATDSVIASLVTGGPRAPATLLKTHLGLDFARSWALSFLTKAVLPAVFGTALLCWGLSGLKLIDLGQRGVYERFGAPVAVLGPGLHVLLPWPLGRLRPVELGAIHALALGVDEMEPAAEVVDVGAEDPPPVSLNRFWETAHPGQANYLVPSPGMGQNGFQSVSTEISVLYRVGLTDDDALKYVYSVSDPAALVKSVADRLVLQYFNSRTLDVVLGARRENVAESLRDALRRDLETHRTGVDVVSVLIEEIHPPAGAAAAYHAVQAAEINANASIFDETGRAKRTAGIAQQEAHQLTSAASATAAETLHTANAESYRFNADRRAYRDGGQAFLLERSYGNIRTALGRAPLTIIDHRLSSEQGPVIDLRSSGAAAGAGSAPRAPASTPPTVTPGIEAPR
jgi:regulator of protease activity HflC (stomatin/prohibitin superfamily)